MRPTSTFLGLEPSIVVFPHPSLKCNAGQANPTSANFAGLPTSLAEESCMQLRLSMSVLMSHPVPYRVRVGPCTMEYRGVLG